MNYNEFFQGKKIYVYGYNNLGRNAYRKMKEMYFDNVKGILVLEHNKRTLEAKKKQKKILELSEIYLQKDSSICIIVAFSLYEEMVKDLKDKGFENVIAYTIELDNWVNKNLKKLPYLETRILVVCVGQACNLKCRDCANFAPYAHKENLRYKIEDIKADLDKIIPYFSEIDTLQIQGGEPFLYSDLSVLLRYIEVHFQHIIGNIQIATNGMIIPNQEILDILNRGGIEVRISNYKFQQNVKRLVELLEQKHIFYRKYNFAGKKGEWSLAGDIDYKDSSEENLYEKVVNCKWNGCYTVENGMVGRCSRSIPARTLQNISIKETDYLNLKETIRLERVGQYFMFINPMDCCRHCKGSNGEPVQAAIQL